METDTPLFSDILNQFALRQPPPQPPETPDDQDTHDDLDQ